MPAVSVIIPTYNRPALLMQAIASVQRQTYTDWEVVVVDDGSVPPSRAAVEGLADPRIRYVYQLNAGLAAACNIGIGISRGHYIGFLGDDDQLLPQALESHVQFLDDHPSIGVVAGGLVYVDAAGRALKEVRPWKWAAPLAFGDWLLGWRFPPSVALIRRRWLDQVAGFDEALRRAEDWDLFLRLARAGCQMAWSEHVVAAYRLHGENLSRDIRLEREACLQTLDKLFAEDLPEDVARKRHLAYAQVHLRTGAKAYAAGDPEMGRSEILQAVEMEPEVLAGSPSIAAETLRQVARHPTVPDAVRFLASVRQDLPHDARQLRSQIRAEIAEEYVRRAYDSHGLGRSSDVRQALKGAIRWRPLCLTDRGILSIALEALLGSRTAGVIRGAAHLRRRGVRS